MKIIYVLAKNSTSAMNPHKRYVFSSEEVRRFVDKAVTLPPGYYLYRIEVEQVEQIG